MTDIKKKLNKRWGHRHTDHRNWPVYNRQFVKRGELYLDLDRVKNWFDELEDMNHNKVGRRFQYPNSLI